jgi:hypothetical protein
MWPGILCTTGSWALTLGLLWETAVTANSSTRSAGSPVGTLSVSTVSVMVQGPSVMVLVSRLEGHAAPETERVKVSVSVSLRLKTLSV